jgi:1-deoxy-D-xylulose-5-phosphate reductoisomerase
VPKRRITVLGSTGSIGTQGLEVIEKHNDKFEIVGLSAGKNFELLADQIRKFKPHKVSVTDDKTADLLKQNLGSPKTEIIVGENASAEIAQLGSDVVLNGITGAAGLPATISALKSGAKLALANKESLVIGGKLVLDIASKDQIIPVDSEHSALAQCLRGENKSQIKKLILTASGGPFRGKSKSELEKVTLEETLKHPTWAMGQVVTINSATLMNKGLEVIEAHLLFGIDFKDIEVVVHPQSIVHSMVEFVDGSTMAQASPPNMKVPIALALSWPDRLENISPAIDWTKSSNWNFEPVDENVFSALEIARKAGEAGGYIPAVMNAANEVCVEAFTQNQIKFTQITDIVEKIVDLFLLNYKKDKINELTLEDIYKMDFEARKKTKEMILP